MNGEHVVNHIPSFGFRLRPSRLAAAGMVATMLLIPSAVMGITSIAQGFFITDSVPVGSIVSLQKDSSDTVEPTATKNGDNILGVVVDSGSTLLSLTASGKKQVQVATSGIVEVLVSDINGDVLAGDQITASPIDGVGMKATTSTKVVGIAQANLKDTQGKKQEQYKDEKGQTHTVTLGQVPLLVNVTYFYKQPEKTIIPPAIQNVANAIAGKAVNPLPIIISLAIFVIAVISIMSLVYAAIHSSIISIGRNPMSQAAVNRSLMQVSALILSILVVAVAAIYLILTRI